LIKNVWILLLLGFPLSVFSQDWNAEYPADDYEDVFLGQDDILKDTRPMRLMYLGVYGGLAAMTAESFGNRSLAFDTGLKFHPRWSAGIFASQLPEVQMVLSKEFSTLFGVEAFFHFDEWISHFYMASSLGVISAQNSSDLGIGLKLGYDLPIFRYFYLSSWVNMFLNSNADQSGHVFQGMIGLKFQRGVK
jgi:hypothetical protein